MAWIRGHRFLVLAAVPASAAASTPFRLPPPNAIVENAVIDGERFWRGANRQPPSVGSRDLFGYALAVQRRQAPRAIRSADFSPQRIDGPQPARISIVQ